MKTPMIDEIPVLGQIKHLYLSATVKCYRTEHLLSLYIDNQLSEKLSHEVEEHLSECASCRAAQLILQAAHTALSSRQEIQPPSYLSERLRQALAIEMSRPTPIKAASPWSTSRLVIGGASFATVIAIAVFAFLPRPLPHTFTPLIVSGPKSATNLTQPTPMPAIKIVPAHPNKVLVATKPGPSSDGISPLRRTIPSRIASDNLIGEPNNQLHIKVPTMAARISEKPDKTGHKASSKSSSIGPIIASNLPKTFSPITGVNPVVPNVPTIIPQPLPIATTQVADNTEQSQHASLFSALKAHVQPGLFAGRTLSTDEPIEQSAVLSGVARVASYTTPGVSFVGHDIR